MTTIHIETSDTPDEHIYENVCFLLWQTIKRELQANIWHQFHYYVWSLDVKEGIRNRK